MNGWHATCSEMSYKMRSVLLCTMKQMLSRLPFFCFEFFYILLTLKCTHQLSNCTTHNPVCVQAGLVLALFDTMSFCLSLYRSNALLHPCGNFTATGQALEVPCGSIFSSAYAAVSSKGAFRLNVITSNEAKCGTGRRYKTFVQIRLFRCSSIILPGSCLIML